MDQVIAHTVRDRAERSHAARHDHHAHRQKRAAGDGRADVANRVARVSQLLHLLHV